MQKLSVYTERAANRFVSIAQMKRLAELEFKDHILEKGTDELVPALYFQVQGYIPLVYIQEDRPLFYQGCNVCRKKVVEMQKDRQYRCDNCDKYHQSAIANYAFSC